jgi:hypothetical protein
VVMSLKHIVVPPPPPPPPPAAAEEVEAAAPQAAAAAEPASGRDALQSGGAALEPARHRLHVELPSTAPPAAAAAAGAAPEEEETEAGSPAAASESAPGGEGRGLELPPAAQQPSSAGHPQAGATALPADVAAGRTSKGAAGCARPGSSSPLIKAGRSCGSDGQRGGSADSCSDGEPEEDPKQQLLLAGGPAAAGQDGSGGPGSSHASSRRVSRASSTAVPVSDMRRRGRPLEIGELMGDGTGAGAAGHGQSSGQEGEGAAGGKQRRATGARLALRSHPISICRADVID